MSSYLSSILTTTTSRYNTLRRTLLSDETDGDTEDDTHISRVLRAYYTEKGRPFPPWLPPDPRAPQKNVSNQFISTSGRPMQQPFAGRGGGLSDLWDGPQQGPPSSAADPLSLRRGIQTRNTGIEAGRGAGSFRQGSEGGVVDSFGGGRGAQRSYTQGPPATERASSFQSTLSRQAASPPPPASSGSGTSAQERLRARLLGSGRSSPTQSPMPSPALESQSSRNPYDRRDRYGSTGSGGSFEEGHGDRNVNPTAGGRRDQKAPVAGAVDPYASRGGDYGGSGRTAYPDPAGNNRGGAASGYTSAGRYGRPNDSRMT